jgi:hypothetical protein
LSVEFGLGFAVNGKLEFDKSQETNILTGNLLQVKNLHEISNFNIYPFVGVTAGFKNFRVNLLGQYGLLNIFDNVNNTLPNANLNGNLLILSSNFIVYF